MHGYDPDDWFYEKGVMDAQESIDLAKERKRLKGIHDGILKQERLLKKNKLDISELDYDWAIFDMQFLPYRKRCKRFYKLEFSRIDGVPIVNDWSENTFNPATI